MSKQELKGLSLTQLMVERALLKKEYDYMSPNNLASTNIWLSIKDIEEEIKTRHAVLL